jgi:hypothetical protein
LVKNCNRMVSVGQDTICLISLRQVMVDYIYTPKVPVTKNRCSKHGNLRSSQSPRSQNLCHRLASAPAGVFAAVAGIQKTPARRCYRCPTRPGSCRISMLRMYLSPRLLVRPKRSLPPLEFCRSVMPSQTANSRPDRNREGSATVAAMALAPMMPTLGAVAGNTIVPLGVDRFGQSGDIPDPIAPTVSTPTRSSTPRPAPA